MIVASSLLNGVVPDWPALRVDLELQHCYSEEQCDEAFGDCDMAEELVSDWKTWPRLLRKQRPRGRRVGELVGRRGGR
jgi:hypothetical protein